MTSLHPRADPEIGRLRELLSDVILLNVRILHHDEDLDTPFKSPAIGTETGSDSDGWREDIRRSQVTGRWTHANVVCEASKTAKA